MKPIALGYGSPELTPSWWRAVPRFFLLGPITGAVVGVVQTTAAVLCWMYYRQPDFYFRGWQDVQMDYVLKTIGGSNVGVAYGLVLCLFERLSGRRIRLAVVIPVLVVLAFVVAGIIAAMAFGRRELGMGLAAELIAVGVGLVLSVGVSRRGP